MIAPGFSSLCKQAELYYYDFIFDESHKSIPKFIIDHLEQCQHCQEQTTQLNRVLLLQTEGYIESEQRKTRCAVTMMLKLHFAYIGEPVTCQIVKPFLPNPSEIKIPTPITTHIDNCPQCSEDLEAIRKLNLSHKQLHRLSQLFGDNSTENNVTCAEAQKAIPSVVSMVFSKIDSKVLKHLCTCPDCSEMIYRHRENTLNGLLRTSLVQHDFPCDKVSAKDFFDYVIPYEIDLTNDQYAKFRESLISHLRTCPDCLDKMQELHTAIYEIYKRVESDVVTTYQIDEPAKAQPASEAGEIYAGFPISVDVRHREEVKVEQLFSPIDFAASIKQKSSLKKLKPMLRTGAIAAAVIFIAAVLLRNIPTAGAAALEKIYGAVAEVKNVHIASFVPDKKEPIQEKWVSRTLNIYLTKTAGQYILWDIADGVRKVKHSDAGPTEINKLTYDKIADIEKEIGGSLGLIPFYSIANLPEGSNWNRVSNEDPEAYNVGIEVYDLTWDRKKYDGSVISWKWRVFVNAETSLPQKTEWYVKLAADTDYILDSVMTIEYLSETDVQTILKRISF